MALNVRFDNMSLSLFRVLINTYLYIYIVFLSFCVVEVYTPELYSSKILNILSKTAVTFYGEALHRQLGR